MELLLAVKQRDIHCMPEILLRVGVNNQCEMFGSNVFGTRKAGRLNPALA
jgi:hypothetical protein